MSDRYTHSFAVVNKSYIVDMRWSVALYRSWSRCNPHNVPFVIVVPQGDMEQFSASFEAEIQDGQIDQLPMILSEEELFSSVGIEIPDDFDGWRTQQVVKLCFAKTGFAQNYLTVDSSMIFTNAFDPEKLFRNNKMCTAAEPASKQDFFGSLRASGEAGWLDGKIANLADSFERMCAIMGNNSLNTNAYISCTGMFNSDLSKKLEQYAHQEGLNGYIGLLQIAPYEFAWYGEFVYSQHPDEFEPHTPHLMTLAHTEQHVDEVMAGTFKVHNPHFGLMFQLPASRLLNPGAVDDRARAGVFN